MYQTLIISILVLGEEMKCKQGKCLMYCGSGTSIESLSQLLAASRWSVTLRAEKEGLKASRLEEQFIAWHHHVPGITSTWGSYADGAEVL